MPNIRLVLFFAEAASAQAAGFFFFLLCAQKKKKQKDELLRTLSEKKAPSAAPELKNHRIFLNEKNSLTLKQLFVLNGKYSIFLHALPRRPEEASFGGCHIASLVDVCFYIPLIPWVDALEILRSTPFRSGWQGVKAFCSEWQIRKYQFKQEAFTSTSKTRNIHPNERSDVA